MPSIATQSTTFSYSLSSILSQCGRSFMESQCDCRTRRLLHKHGHRKKNQPSDLRDGMLVETVSEVNDQKSYLNWFNQRQTLFSHVTRKSKSYDTVGFRSSNNVIWTLLLHHPGHCWAVSSMLVRKYVSHSQLPLASA